MPVDAHADPAAVIEALQVSTTRAATVDDVLAVVGEVLSPCYDLCRVSLRRILPGGQEVEVVAVWSRRRSEVAPGVRMPLRSTSIATILATGRTQFGAYVQATDGLLHQLLAAEGIRSYAAVPLGDVAAGAQILNLSSAVPDAFTEDDLPLLEAVGAVVAKRLAKLPASS